MTLDITSLVQGLESEIVASAALPYCQVQNPPNMTLANIAKMNPAYGIFITKDQADLANFKGGDNWEETTIEFGSGAVDGYIARKLRFVVVAKSPSLVLGKVDNRYTVLGETYKNGSMTELGIRANADSQNYRIRQSIAILFLDNDNNLLHQTPFKLSLSPAVGVGLSIARKQNLDEISSAVFAALGKPKQALSAKAQALMVTELELGAVKSGTQNAPYVYPTKLASCKGESTYDNRGKKTECYATEIQNLLLAQGSGTGKEVMEVFENYQDYFSTPVKEEVKEPTPVPVMVNDVIPSLEVDIPF